MRNDATAQPAVQERLRDWFQRPPGELLLAQEQACLEQLLPDLFGHYLVQLGAVGAGLDLSAVSRFRRHVVLDVSVADWGKALPLIGEARRLPVATDSVDAMLMLHTLDFSPKPHQVLREADRVLIAEGRLIIAGFNPWSLWGLWRLVHRGPGRIPWCGRFLALRRLQDWLSLLGFKVELTRHLMFRPPLGGRGIMGRFEFMERLGQHFWSPLAGVYVVQAVKRGSNLKPVGRIWAPRARLLGGRVVEPTARGSNG
ncbi:MAG TPA: methyltransferase domain-containing protein [Sedimenticola sp.]|nr:methyltransferase domain-containing protein [Sedimenticola sp.]